MPLLAPGPVPLINFGQDAGRLPLVAISSLAPRFRRFLAGRLFMKLMSDRFSALLLWAFMSVSLSLERGKKRRFRRKNNFLSGGQARLSRNIGEFMSLALTRGNVVFALLQRALGTYVPIFLKHDTKLERI